MWLLFWRYLISYAGDGEAFAQAHAGRLGRVERRVMGAITACRTAALSRHV